MADNTFKQFLIVNQISIVQSTITCTKCSNWLTPPIFVRNNVNYCGECLPKKGERNKALEDILNNHKYPCFNEHCEALLDYSETQQHATTCNSVSKCVFCDAICDRRKIWAHIIAKHETQTIVTDKPKFDFSITMPLISLKTHFIQMYTEQFLFFYIQENEDLKVALKKLVTDDRTDLGKYTIRMTTNTGRTSSQDGVLQRIGACHSVENEIGMYIGDAGSCKVEVSIGPRQHIDLPDCPICMEVLSAKVRQCDNGHNVCEDCGAKINTCPICREKIAVHLVNVQHLYPDAMWPCSNRKSGCLAYFNRIEDKQHADLCEFRMVTCRACARSTRKCDFINHMKSEHVLQDNFDVILSELSEKNMSGSSTAYIIFDSEVFQCYIMANDIDVILSCEMAYMNAKCTHQYRFEFHIISDIETTIAKHIFTDVMCINSNCCLISWQKLFVSEIPLPLCVRCCIFKNDLVHAIPCVEVNGKLRTNMSDKITLKAKYGGVARARIGLSCLHHRQYEGM